MQDEPDTDEDAAPPPPPAAFGLPAEPAGCGLIAGLGFAALTAPLFFNPPNVSRCVYLGGECLPVGDDLWAGIAGTAMLALAFGAATAALVLGRLRAWRAGRKVRPPLWVAFVALLVLGTGAAGFALVPLELLVQRVMAP